MPHGEASPFLIPPVKLLSEDSQQWLDFLLRPRTSRDAVLPWNVANASSGLRGERCSYQAKEEIVRLSNQRLRDRAGQPARSRGLHLLRAVRQRATRFWRRL